MDTIQNISKPRTTPKDFFLHLGGVVFLYLSVVSVLILLFGIIDQVWPKEFGYTDPYAGGVSIAMAILVVAFPLCLFFLHIVSKGELAMPEKREVWIRKAFMYCTLFIVIVAVAIDLIVLLDSFFSGEEITLAFMLKILSIMFVLGVVARYYWYDLHRKDEDDGVKARNRYALGATIFVILAMGVGFAVMGSPYTQKEKRFDAERVNALQTIQYSIVNYWQMKGKLPSTLAELNDPLAGITIPFDPADSKPYEYEATGKTTFRLCATFSRETPTGNNFSQMETRPMMPEYKGGVNENWKHIAGRICFDRSIDPELYPLRKDMFVPQPVPVMR